MRIIKQGKKPSEEKEKTCGKCKTIFAYVPADVNPDWRDGDYVKCPTCGAFINISS